ncbi:hypothetical protein SNEBB_008804 [Seison nebaliae]|nr:hypothetical protein SNEBB_008804 [Seison nebaliae]
MKIRESQFELKEKTIEYIRGSLMQFFYSCTNKKQILCFFTIVGFGALVLYIEYITTLNLKQYRTDNVYRTNGCWSKEQFHITHKCRLCSPFELKYEKKCNWTGYIEEIQCEHKGNESRVCAIPPELSENRFNTFFISNILIFLVSILIITLRKNELRMQYAEFIRRRLSRSV